jgi:hypothetical protein
MFDYYIDLDEENVTWLKPVTDEEFNEVKSFK